MAEAHSPLKGAGDFYSGFLHPVVIPAEALSVIAVALVLGTSGVTAARWGMLAQALGIVIGFGIGAAFTVRLPSTFTLLGTALIAAAIVTAGLRTTAPVAALIAVSGGVAIGLDAQPDSESVRGALLSYVGTLLGSGFATILIAALVLGRNKHWERIATRVAASWITASAILYFAWQSAALPK